MTDLMSDKYGRDFLTLMKVKEHNRSQQKKDAGSQVRAMRRH